MSPSSSPLSPSSLPAIAESNEAAKFSEQHCSLFIENNDPMLVMKSPLGNSPPKTADSMTSSMTNQFQDFFSKSTKELKLFSSPIDKVNENKSNSNSNSNSVIWGSSVTPPKQSLLTKRSEAIPPPPASMTRASSTSKFRVVNDMSTLPSISTKTPRRKGSLETRTKK